MKVTILLVSLAVLAFKNSFYNNHQILKNTNETAAYIHKMYQHENVIADTVNDTSFISKAIQANQHEIMMAQMALQKSSSAEVKELAQRLITDHTQLLQQLQNLHGTNSGNTNNNAAYSHTMDSTGINNMYNNISGITFDRQWVGDMIAGHQKTLTDFRTELNTTNDAALKALINNALPTIQEHLKKLQVLRGKMM
jgi:putative membrane protein